jgi:hypothetical protein
MSVQRILRCELRWRRRMLRLLDRVGTQFVIEVETSPVGVLRELRWGLQWCMVARRLEG